MADEWVVATPSSKSEGGSSDWTVAPKPSSKKDEPRLLPYDETARFGEMPEVKMGTMPYQKQMGRIDEALRAAERGLVKGAVGLPGELEYLGAYAAPELIGKAVPSLRKKYPESFGPTPPEKQVQIFPRSETVGKMMEQIGLGPTPERAKGFEQAGEFVGGLTGFGASSAPKIAAPVVEKTAKAAERAGGAISGTRLKTTVEKLGKPSSASEIGTKIEKEVLDPLTKNLANRRKEAEKVFDTYLEAAKPFEQNIKADFMQRLRDIYAKRAESLSAEERKLFNQIQDRLAARPKEMGGEATVEAGIGALEKERRFLNDIANGIKPEGYDAIPYQLARDMAEAMTGSIRKYAQQPFDQAMRTYAELSRPIDVANSVLGGKVTKRAGDFLPDLPRFDPATYGPAFFKSQQSVNVLRELTGNEQVVQGLAREYLATQLKDLKTAQQVADVYRRNYDWLRTVPELDAELRTIVQNVGGGDILKKLGLIGGGVAVGSSVLSPIKSMLGL